MARAARFALIAEPLLTLVCIVVTGNHFFVDGVGGIVVFVGGHAIGARVHRVDERRLEVRQG
jgi:hypothetical protein